MLHRLAQVYMYHLTVKMKNKIYRKIYVFVINVLQIKKRKYTKLCFRKHRGLISYRFSYRRLPNQ